MSLPPSLPSHGSQERAFRPLSSGSGPSSAGNHAIAQISAAQLLPNFQSLYAQNPGALLGSGQAAGMALGSHTHNPLSSGLNSTSGPLAMGAARYLAGLGMNTVSGHPSSSAVSSTVASFRSTPLPCCIQHGFLLCAHEPLTLLYLCSQCTECL